MTSQEIIEVVTAHENGAVIEFISKRDVHWIACDDHPTWNFARYNYRKKPEAKRIPWTAETAPFPLAIRYHDWAEGVYVMMNIGQCHVWYISFEGNVRYIAYSDLANPSSGWETREGKPCCDFEGGE